VSSYRVDSDLITAMQSTTCRRN